MLCTALHRSGPVIVFVNDAAHEAFLANEEIELLVVNDPDKSAEFQVVECDATGKRTSAGEPLSQEEQDKRDASRAERRALAKERAAERDTRTHRVFYELPGECVTSPLVLNAYLKAIQDTANALPVEKASCTMARTTLGRYMNKALLFITVSAANSNIDLSTLKWIKIGETFARASMPAVSAKKFAIKTCCFRKDCPNGPKDCDARPTFKRSRPVRADVPEPDYVREKRERQDARQAEAEANHTNLTGRRKKCKRWEQGKCQLIGTNGRKKCFNAHGDTEEIHNKNIKCQGNFTGWYCALGGDCPYKEHSELPAHEGHPAPPPDM